MTTHAPNAMLRRTPTQVRGAARVEVILKAAAELFDEIGYDAATTILIAQRAKTAVGSLYGFFPNKEVIAQALVERFAADLRALMEGVLNERLQTAPLAQVLDGLIDPLVQFIHTHPGFRALYLNAPQVGQFSAAQRGIEAALTQRMASLLLQRFPGNPMMVTQRVARVCIETTKALTALAIQGRGIDQAVVADLKAMINRYLISTLAVQHTSARKHHAKP